MSSILTTITLIQAPLSLAWTTATLLIFMLLLLAFNFHYFSTHSSSKMMSLKSKSGPLRCLLITRMSHKAHYEPGVISSTLLHNTLPVHCISYTWVSFLFCSLNTASSCLTGLCNCYASVRNILLLCFKQLVHSHFSDLSSNNILRQNFLYLQILSIISFISLIPMITTC